MCKIYHLYGNLAYVIDKFQYKEEDNSWLGLGSDGRGSNLRNKYYAIIKIIHIKYI